MKKPIRPKHHIVTAYWLAYYATDLCTLCGNSGVIDTTEARTGTGRRVGCKNYCICPNGQTMRANGIPLENRHFPEHHHATLFQRPLLAHCQV